MQRDDPAPAHFDGAVGPELPGPDVEVLTPGEHERAVGVRRGGREREDERDHLGSGRTASRPPPMSGISRLLPSGLIAKSAAESIPSTTVS